MMSGQQIREISDKATRKAMKAKKKPYRITQDDLDKLKAGSAEPLSRFPFLGDYVYETWVKMEDYFVDSSGFGSDDEPALTIPQFIDKLVVGRGYAITEAGEFQVYIGEYVKK